MHPLPLFQLFGYGINLYVLAYVLGFFPTLALAVWLGRRRRVRPVVMVDAAFLAIAAAFVLARLYSALTRS